MKQKIQAEKFASGNVSAAAVKKLYQQFRQATLESTARELQQQTLSNLDSKVTNLPQNLRDSLSSPDIEPNQFDSCLKGIAQVNFLGLRFHKMCQQQAIETLFELTKTGKAYRVYFANAHSIEVASRNSEFFSVLKRSNLLMADGSGVLMGSRLAGCSLTHNLNGTDLIPALCQAASPQRRLSIYFLGAKPGVAQQAATNLANRYPGMQIAGVSDGYFSEAETPQVLHKIREANPDILLVAMGTPTQEMWIDKYAQQLPGVVCVAVGGLFDFMAGQVLRAPKLLNKLGVEWVWRLMMEPNRLWRRYTIGNLIYLKVLFTSIIHETINRWQGKSALDDQSLGALKSALQED
jgi:N-acetylglucosaminyldiphosphoundecaprenol N-acetyl-beta-D-mannosaminyltransferase